eukprot:scaffold37118_cov18-Tisochrysis_lutea.AAC.2
MVPWPMAWVYDAQKGTFTELGMLDVQQIFGRAGRPQASNMERLCIKAHILWICASCVLYNARAILGCPCNRVQACQRNKCFIDVAHLTV